MYTEKLSLRAVGIDGWMNHVKHALASRGRGGGSAASPLLGAVRGSGADDASDAHGSALAGADAARWATGRPPPIRRAGKTEAIEVGADQLVVRLGQNILSK